MYLLKQVYVDICRVCMFMYIVVALSLQIREVVTHSTQATDPTTLAVVVRFLTSITPNPGHRIPPVGDRDGLNRGERNRRKG